jgi:hypothetical protein
VQWPRPRVEDLEDLYMPGEWPLARLKEPVSMLAPVQSCVCIDSMDGWVALSVSSHHRAMAPESVPAGRAPTVWGRICNARYPPIS